MTPCDEFNLHPPTYKTIMTVLSALTPPVNIFAIYCILRKSTSQMGPYKWFLLAYQSTSTAFDFVLTIIVLPVVFFPIPMGYADSAIAQLLSLNTHVALCSVVITAPILTVCIVALFLYRCHVIIPHHHFLKINKKGQTSLITAILLIICTPVILSLVRISPDQMEARKWTLTVSCSFIIESVIKFDLNERSELSMRRVSYKCS
ncbi:hypothetical protein Y032_0352g3282 [Ancylostoma ceylanicum]|uniref:Uncharacterized protein n=1 Tax=Ancylostoma ceylanicum TaxID=53326 RepID=A0A016RWJ7_9BILA|nr:hypothetical protein Y032_0352g3282 [Ancylostoma ceylanicum]